MKLLGYWASQEQYSINDLISFVREAESGGFTATMTSDHFHPWWNDGGFGNFTWVWLTAAAERTKHMKFVTGVTSPVYRYNPAIIAQAFASLDVLYPGRISLGIGTGEAMNEVSVGFDWPLAKIRLARTIEAIHIINHLWNKKQEQLKSNDNNKVKSDPNSEYIDDEGFLTYEGQYFRTRSAKLYTSSLNKIPLYMAASGTEAIHTAAKYTDGLITITKPDKSKETFVEFDKAALKAGKDPQSLQKIGKPKISYSEDYDKAFKSAGFWRAGEIENVFDSPINDPRKLQEKALKEVSDEKLKESTLIITSIEDLINPLEEYFKVGFTQIYLHSTSPNELDFVQEFCKKVLPYFARMNE
ncbi:LLM class flavin-dependent oxidoreductase [Candidatus Nitrosocosmicus hydrocola]|uniref:LLM class flavin-dependent oxidoreductase n=1 Tax=Candidatus Nitrosocosmicus hydrocola TaxID=1826872 RepID=UPI0011E5F576|nr:LLM class flavin-dependent oxidoreductase [Candidatus Nitrosocosmicus hydrocola]